MASIAALVFDIDGTLIVPGSPPSAATITALTACRDAGLPCFAATARTPESAAMALGELSWLTVSGVFHNGAVGRCAESAFSVAEDLDGGVIASAVAIVESSWPGTFIELHTHDDRPAFSPEDMPEEMLRGWAFDPR